MTCARSRCNATPAERFLHTSRCTFDSPHFTLHSSHSTLHLISSRLIWFLLTACYLISALLIASHPFSHVIQVSSSQLFSPRPSTEKSSSQLISALLHARKILLLQRIVLQKRALRAGDLHELRVKGANKGECMFSNKSCMSTYLIKTKTRYLQFQAVHGNKIFLKAKTSLYNNVTILTKPAWGRNVTISSGWTFGTLTCRQQKRLKVKHLLQ